MRASPIKTNFTAGELSPRLDGRVDIAKYANGCKQLQNFIPLTQGPATRRAGTTFVSEVKQQGNKTWLSSFVFNDQQAFILEFGNYYIRLYQNHGYVAANASAWNSGTAYTVGDVVSRSGTNYYCITAHTNVEPPSGLYWTALTSDIYEIPTPFFGDMLTNADGTFGLSTVQSGDVIYIATRGYRPCKLQRFSNTKWVLDLIQFQYGPFESVNTDESVTVYSTAQTGTTTLTTNAADLFTNIPVGGLFYLQQKVTDNTSPWEADKSITTNDLRYNNALNYKATNTATTGFIGPVHTRGSKYDGEGGVKWEYQNPGYGIAQKVSDASSTVMNVTIVNQIPAGATGSGNPSYVWARAAWDDVAGYPTYVTFFRQRLVFARDRTLWFSCVADYDNFALKEFGEVLAESAISFNIDTSDTSQITYLSPTKQGLIVGTQNGELLISEDSINEVFSPMNIKVSPSTGYGSRAIKPINVDDAILFVQRGGLKLRESQFNIQIDNFSAIDLSVLSDHITKTGIVDMTYQLSPYSIVWLVRSDGILVGFTYNKSQDVTAWHRHIIGGGFSSGNAVVESVASIPNPNGLRDDLWLIIKRTINGSTVRYVEYMKEEYANGDAATTSFYVDSGLSYSGAPATTISGLDHLIGQTVKVLADGAAHPDRVVNNSGQITLARAASDVTVGLGYTSILQTMRVEAGSGDGTSQGKIKRINEIMVRVLDTSGLLASNDGVTYDSLAFRSTTDLMDNPVPLVSGDCKITTTGYNTDGYIYLKQDTVFPTTIIAIMPQVTTSDKG
jgi:hypothetical protein